MPVVFLFLGLGVWLRDGVGWDGMGSSGVVGGEWEEGMRSCGGELRFEIGGKVDATSGVSERSDHKDWRKAT